jgi:hypothetical protein
VNDATASMPGEVPQVDIDMNLQGPFPVGGS